MASYAPGRYLCRTTAIELGKSSKKGTPGVFIKFRPLGMIDPNDPQGTLLGCDDYERTISRWLTGDAAEYTIRDLQTLGYQHESLSFLDPANANYRNMAGRDFEARCHHESYEGKIVERWEFAIDGSGMEVKRLEQSEIRKLDALFGKKLKEGAVKKAPAENEYSGPAEPAEAAIPAEDIPF